MSQRPSRKLPASRLAIQSSNITITKSRQRPQSMSDRNSINHHQWVLSAMERSAIAHDVELAKPGLGPISGGTARGFPPPRGEIRCPAFHDNRHSQNRCCPRRDRREFWEKPAGVQERQKPLSFRKCLVGGRRRSRRQCVEAAVKLMRIRSPLTVTKKGADCCARAALRLDAKSAQSVSML